MLDEKTKSNEEKIYEAFSKNVKVHLKLKDRSFRNGMVVETHADFFIFMDEINGEEPFFYIELRDVNPYFRKEVKA